MMRNFIPLALTVPLLLLGLPEASAAETTTSTAAVTAAAATTATTPAAPTENQIELDFDYLTPISSDRKVDTYSLHILQKISESETRSVYRGLTVTRAYGNVTLTNLNQHTPRDSSTVGVGPVYMVRNEKYRSGKFSAAIDMSGGLILYDKAFPAGGRSFNFMWRIGPELIYKFDKDSSIHLGYMLMHVSDGFKTRNPSYNATGVTLGFSSKF
ncbi:MAG: acyloxyacyl hydrolase [Sporomusaceae bacterium]|nr:acyloxyacyl hydrolase [Sporomusaceae bacterium]